jgi:hypothetical protein
MYTSASQIVPYSKTESKLSPSQDVPVELDTADTGIEKLEPVPPILAAAADKVLPTTYKIPPFVIVTAVTAPPATVIVANAPLPEPPVKGTLKYVPVVYALPPVIAPTEVTMP